MVNCHDAFTYIQNKFIFSNSGSTEVSCKENQRRDINNKMWITTLYKTLVLFILLFAACAARQQTIQTWGKAEKFLQALNMKDIDTMMAVSETPFFFRNQEWETTRDGIGFVLGKAKDQILPDKDTLRSFFKELVTKVKVEETKAAENPPSRKEFLENQLKGIPNRWSHLELYVFRRGFGDVEHIALVGVDPQSHKVIALYLN